MTTNKMRSVFVLLILLLPVVAAAEVLVTLDVVPQQTLPGIPAALQIRVENNGPAAVALRNGAELEVTPQAAPSFVAADPGGEPVWAPLDSRTTADVLLQPGEVKTFHQSPGCSLAEQLHFLDARLSMPGSYALRVKLYPAGDSPLPIHSSTATLVVQQPSGADAAVWTRMQQLTASRGRQGFTAADWIDHQFNLADEIYSSYPSSSYLPYVACFKRGATPEQRIAQHQQALALNPTGPVADVVKLGIAGLHHQIADEARAALDEAKAVAANAEARRILQEVLAGSAYAHIRETAGTVLGSMRTEADLRRVIAILRAQRVVPPAVTPLVDCVQVRRNGSFTARFGYNNTGSENVNVPAGSADNLISPATDVRKQPSVFKPGEYHNVFRVESAGQPIIWSLLGRTATASPSSQRCGGNPHD